MSALDTQIGGDHYKKLKIQPVEYMHANGIPFIEGCIIKYASRWRDKGGIADLEKIKHFAQLLIDLETAEAASEQCGQNEAASSPPDGYSWDDAPEFADILIQHLDDGGMYWAQQSTGKCEAIGSAVRVCRVSYPSDYFKLLSSRPTSTAK